MKSINLILFVGFITNNWFTVNTDGQTVTYRLPAEWEPHQRTLMVWPHLAIPFNMSSPWSKDDIPTKEDQEYLDELRRNVALLANTIVEFEPVVVFAGPGQVQLAQRQLDPAVQVVGMNVDDLWARDTSPVFVSKLTNGKESISGVVFNFNGWGNKQLHENDGQLAKNILEMYGFESIVADIIGEGGSFETDGIGTLLVTKSSIVNENRNNKTLEEIEIELKKVLGIKKIIWFEGVKGKDITDGHVDGLVRFIRPGVVVLNRSFPGDTSDCESNSTHEAYSVLMNSTDADGNPFEIIDIFQPNRSLFTNETGCTYCTSYVNFLIGNGFVIIPAFGDFESDWTARKIFQEQFPDRIIVPIEISAISEGGGGIHCSTYAQPAETNAGKKVESPSLLLSFSILPIILARYLLKDR